MLVAHLQHAVQYYLGCITDNLHHKPSSPSLLSTWQLLPPLPPSSGMLIALQHIGTNTVHHFKMKFGLGNSRDGWKMTKTLSEPDMDVYFYIQIWFMNEDDGKFK